jgi:hypothetical protein
MMFADCAIVLRALGAGHPYLVLELLLLVPLFTVATALPSNLLLIPRATTLLVCSPCRFTQQR